MKHQTSSKKKEFLATVYRMKVWRAKRLSELPKDTAGNNKKTFWSNKCFSGQWTSFMLSTTHLNKKWRMLRYELTACTAVLGEHYQIIWISTTWFVMHCIQIITKKCSLPYRINLRIILHCFPIWSYPGFVHLKES